jgi:hypothetical protein
MSRMLVILVLVFAAVPAEAEHVMAFTFDWDDNVFEMPTKILLFDKKAQREVGVTTEDYALVRDQVGKPGTPYADHELRLDPKTGSLRHFGDLSGEGAARFQKDIDQAMRGAHWRGPVWSDFVAACARRDTARHTSFLTARMHAPETMHAAFRRFQAKGLIRHVPPVENIWAVGHPSFDARFQSAFRVAPPSGSMASPSARKAAVMEQALDRIQRTPVPRGTRKVLSPDGTGRGRYHLWGFSDDDLGNFKKAVEVLQKGVDRDRWSSVKITVFYTGTNTPAVKPHAVVLAKARAPRPYREGAGEWKSVLKAR